MNLSLNEVESIARKAARGAGYDWGNCEEAGWAVRWLCSFKLDGCGALAAQLRHDCVSSPTDATPRAIGKTWKASGDFMCPILAGAAISDFAYASDEVGWVLESVANPMLLLPFASRIAQQMRSVVSVSWCGTETSASAEQFGVKVGHERLDAAHAQYVNVSIGGTLCGLLPKVHRVWPAADHWDALVALAGRTYAPATEESRSLGAGGGLDDND